ncbi:MAG: hypothetical protein CEO40_113 [Parcubacteria group bacterium LiPW_72]|nr:MAG: hypothetical protein CEO40_113 [Parcubacteria group bacterium LiPW_72]
MEMEMRLNFKSDYDLLGEIIMNCYRFRKNNFNEQLSLFCPVNNQNVEAGRMFAKKIGKRKSYFVENDFLPADADIKAIAVNHEEIQIETSPLDEEYLRKDLISGFDTKITYNSRSVHNAVIQQEKTHIISFIKRNDRWLWIICIRHMEKWQDLICQIADRIYLDGCFIDTELDQIVPQKITSGLSIIQQIEQALTLEQKPMLIMGMREKPQMSQVQTIYALQSIMMKMTPEELEEQLLKDLTLDKAKKYMRILIFTIAGKLKNAEPRLTWKEARSLARRMIDKGVE